jgi:hypothetical protein
MYASSTDQPDNAARNNNSSSTIEPAATTVNISQTTTANISQTTTLSTSTVASSSPASVTSSGPLPMLRFVDRTLECHNVNSYCARNSSVIDENCQTVQMNNRAIDNLFVRFFVRQVGVSPLVVGRNGDFGVRLLLSFRHRTSSDIHGRTLFLSGAYKMGWNRMFWSLNFYRKISHLANKDDVQMLEVRLCWVFGGAWRGTVEFSNATMTFDSTPEERVEEDAGRKTNNNGTIAPHHLALLVPSSGQRGDLHVPIFCNYIIPYLDKKIGPDAYEILVVNQVRYQQ